MLTKTWLTADVKSQWDCDHCQVGEYLPVTGDQVDFVAEFEHYIDAQYELLQMVHCIPIVHTLTCQGPTAQKKRKELKRELLEEAKKVRKMILGFFEMVEKEMTTYLSEEYHGRVGSKVGRKKYVEHLFTKDVQNAERNAGYTFYIPAGHRVPPNSPRTNVPSTPSTRRTTPKSSRPASMLILSNSLGLLELDPQLVASPSSLPLAQLSISQGLGSPVQSSRRDSIPPSPSTPRTPVSADQSTPRPMRQTSLHSQTASPAPTHTRPPSSVGTPKNRRDKTKD